MGANASEDARKWNGLTNEIQRLLKSPLSNQGNVTLSMDTAGASSGAWRFSDFIDSRAPRLVAVDQEYRLASGFRYRHGAGFDAITASGAFG
jgi:hypothetical protein